MKDRSQRILSTLVFSAGALMLLGSIGCGSAAIEQDRQQAEVYARSAGPSSARSLRDYRPVLPAVLERAWKIDPDRGVETREVARDIYVITDGVWQSAFVVTAEGVIVLDAPESFGSRIQAEVAAVTTKPITKLVYSHVHSDHIGGAASLAGIGGLEILALKPVAALLAELADPARPLPTRTFEGELILTPGGRRIELRAAHYHSDEGDLIVYVPDGRFLMAVDTLAPGYVPFMGFDITSNFHEYAQVFDLLLEYEFDVFVGGHLSHPGDRRDVEVTREFVQDVLETTRRVHQQTDLMTVFSQSAQEIGSFDNKYLLFKSFLDAVTARATSEIEARWADRLAGVDVWTAEHVKTALIYVRWDE